ncbi:MAG: diaminobutyrate--2-oxoglutarate transaminase [Rhodovibrionaceae bacterium]|nr:diaminobutyrate--2-oxoglutarate transaminase [Rhodovibrionaceae bacterium]
MQISDARKSAPLAAGTLERIGSTPMTVGGRKLPKRFVRYEFRQPSHEDGSALWDLVKDTGVLDVNSAYSYLLLGKHFDETCVVAERKGEIRGFVSAFCPPGREDTVFVWQIGVAQSERGRGLAKALLHELVRRPACRQVRFLEATVTPSNRASRALFRAFARDLGARCYVGNGFEAEHFPGDGDYEAENLFRIGPFEINDTEEDTLKVFEKYESEVRSYCRDFPTVFDKARGYTLWSEDGREYIDFFAGAGALNYGHNHPAMKQKIIEYMTDDGITHSLDMATTAKARFLQRFHDVILAPRGMTHKVMFPGPTGTNTVEAALKLARKITGRDKVVSFTNAFHGMTLGSLAVTGNAFKREGAGIPLQNVTHVPFDGYLGEDVDTLEYLERMLADEGSGMDLPAAIIVEPVQGEGGVNVASFDWLKRLEHLCRRWDILLIVDDVQAGCGRTGSFFSYEPAGIDPDIVCLSKSIGGYGLPLALTLIKPQYDKFAAGEHNGTFRGNNLAFVAATEALGFWEDDELTKSVQAKGEKAAAFLQKLADKYPELEGEVRGRGLMLGLAIADGEVAGKICEEAFQRGLLVETSGPNGEVIKLLPPLIIDDVGLERGLSILGQSVEEVVARKTPEASTPRASDDAA